VVVQFLQCARCFRPSNQGGVSALFRRSKISHVHLHRRLFLSSDHIREHLCLVVPISPSNLLTLGRVVPYFPTHHHCRSPLLWVPRPSTSGDAGGPRTCFAKYVLAFVGGHQAAMPTATALETSVEGFLPDGWSSPSLPPPPSPPKIPNRQTDLGSPDVNTVPY
jgi:hypothetical protein